MAVSFQQSKHKFCHMRRVEHGLCFKSWFCYLLGHFYLNSMSFSFLIIKWGEQYFIERLRWGLNEMIYVDRTPKDGGREGWPIIHNLSQLSRIIVADMVVWHIQPLFRHLFFLPASVIEIGKLKYSTCRVPSYHCIWCSRHDLSFIDHLSLSWNWVTWRKDHEALFGS